MGNSRSTYPRAALLGACVGSDSTTATRIGWGTNNPQTGTSVTGDGTPRIKSRVVTKKLSSRLGKPYFSVRGALICVVVTVLIVAAGAWYGIDSNSEAAYWSSAAGTAAGGMVAVLAAYFFWQADRYYAEKNRQTDVSHRAAQEIHRLNRLIRKSAWNGVYDKESGFPEIDDKFKTTLDDLVGQIEAQRVWLSGDALTVAVEQMRKYLTADTRLEVEVPDNLRLAARTFEGTRWLDDLLVEHVKGSLVEVAPVAGWEAFRPEYEAYEAERQEWEAAYDAWWEEEKLRLIEENRKKSEELRAQQDKDRSAGDDSEFPEA